MEMKQIGFVLLVVWLSLFNSKQVKAQEQPDVWTLRSCLDYALQNNIQIKKSKVAHESGLEDTEQA